MAQRQLSVDEARELAIRYKEGEFDDDEQLKRTVRDGIVQAAQRSQGKVIDNAKLTEDEPGLGSDIARRTSGAVQVAGTIASGALAEPVSGIAGIGGGLVGLLQGEGFSDAAVRTQRAVADFLTFDPKTDTGQEMLEGIAAPLKKLDDAIDWIATESSFDNPVAAAAIYTTLLGAIDIVGLRGIGRGKSGVGTSVRHTRELEKRLARVQKIADDLGIDLTPSELASSIVDAAKEMSPQTRAANAAGLRDALSQADELQKASAANKADLARGSKTFVDVQKATEFAQQAGKELLEEGFDLSKMKNVVERLGELENLRTRSPIRGELSVERVSAQIQDIQTISNRIEKMLDSRAKSPKVRRQPKTIREDLALTQLKSKLDNWLDQQFNSDMITGDVRGIRRWKEATEARRKYNERFLEDKTILQLMDRNATPGEVNRWLMGASAANAKPAAVRTIRRIKELLGENHPSIEGIRQDFLFEITSPLLNDVVTPSNFRQVVRNIDNVIKKQSHLIDELDVDVGRLRGLQKLSRGAFNENIRPLFNIDFAKSIAVLKFGSGLAKKGLIVRGATLPIRLMGRLLFGKTIFQKKVLLNELAGANWKAPFMDRLAGPAGYAIDAVFASNIVDTVDEEKIREAVGK